MRAILRTEDASYCTCEVISINPKTVTIRYCKAAEWDSKSQQTLPIFVTETINRNKIVSLAYRT